MSEKRDIALEAGMILNSPLFNDVFDELDAKYVQAWRNSTNALNREDWWYLQRALAAVRGELMEKLKCAAVSKSGKDDSQIQAAYRAAKEKS